MELNGELDRLRRLMFDRRHALWSPSNSPRRLFNKRLRPRKVLYAEFKPNLEGETHLRR